jgi:hypothetical protein
LFNSQKQKGQARLFSDGLPFQTTCQDQGTTYLSQLVNYPP